MKVAPLSTEQAPPIDVPLRFFAIAPFFLMLAALLLATAGRNPFTDMHSAAMIAVTHCITLGFMAMVMLGAIQQMLPVVIGSPMPAPRLIAWLTYLPLLAGSLLLPGGFMLGRPDLLNLSWPLLGLGFLIFISAALHSLMRAAAQNSTRTAILLSILSLALAVSVGMLLARGYAVGMPLPYNSLATAHVSLALGGWITLLIAGVSYQVVPMFQITPNYPKWLTVGLAPALFAVLLLNLVPLLYPAPQWLALVAEIIFWLLAGSFAIATLWLQNQRRRRVPDPTLSFFRLGMASLLLAAIFSLASQFSPATHDVFRMLSAMAFLAGFAMSLTQGMLYKIIPFLVWFHLFRGGINAVKAGIPNMKEIIQERWMWLHLRIHVVTLLAVLLAPFQDIAAWMVVPGLLAQGILLSYAAFAGISVYRNTLSRIEMMPAQESH